MLMCTLISLPVSAKNDGPEHEVQATFTRMEQALNGANLQKLKSVYAHDAVLIPAEAKVLNHRKAIVSFWNNRFSSAKSRYHFNVVRYQIGKNIARLSVLWSATIITPDIQTEVKYGYLTNVLIRQPDGSWKILEQNWD